MTTVQRSEGLCFYTDFRVAEALVAQRHPL
jgi:hypothetical protein